MRPPPRRHWRAGRAAGCRPTPPPRQWRLAGVIFFSALALVILYAALKIIWPFLTAIIVGAILVTVTFPTFKKVRARMRGGSGRAAVVMLIGITFLLIIPVF